MDTTTLRESAFIVEPIGRARAVVLNFHGLGDPGLRVVPFHTEAEYAANGAVVMVPYLGPWSWMNRLARRRLDGLVDALWSAYALPADAPLILTGGSMGGYCSLLYARYARRRPKACLATHPVCDLEHHLHERPDLPRTIHAAFTGLDEPLADLLREHSPLAQVAGLPDIPYLILHGDADQAVAKGRHSDRMVAAMRARGLKVEYVEVPGWGHSDYPTFALQRKAIGFVLAALG